MGQKISIVCLSLKTARLLATLDFHSGQVQDSMPTAVPQCTSFEFQPHGTGTINYYESIYTKAIKVIGNVNELNPYSLYCIHSCAHILNMPLIIYLGPSLCQEHH